MTTLAGIIIAGGKSVRMDGHEKAFLEVSGIPLIEQVIARLAPQVDMLALNANGDPERFARLGLPVIPDELMDTGPLAGIAASLEWAEKQGASHVLTAASDTPFFPEDLAKRMLEAAPNGSCIAACKGRTHPLFGLWLVGLHGELHSWLVSDKPRAVHRFAEAHGFAAVDFPETEFAGGAFDPFFNINTPENLAEAIRIAEGMKKPE